MTGHLLMGRDVISKNFFQARRIMILTSETGGSGEQTRQNNRLKSFESGPASFDFRSHDGAFPRFNERSSQFFNVCFAIEIAGRLRLLQAIR